jgi:hypothetical protein
MRSRGTIVVAMDVRDGHDSTCLFPFSSRFPKYATIGKIIYELIIFCQDKNTSELYLL